MTVGNVWNMADWHYKNVSLDFLILYTKIKSVFIVLIYVLKDVNI